MGILPVNEEGVAAFKNDLLALYQNAFELQGASAFTNPLSATLAHEAGHAIIYANEREPLKFVKVWPMKRSEARDAIKTHNSHFKDMLIELRDMQIEKGTNWTGITVPVNEEAFSISPFTPAEFDLRHARITVAGWAGELVFDRDNFRLGSSLDEIVVTRQIAHAVSLKVGISMEEVMGSYIVLPVVRILQAHEEVARELIRHLRRHGAIRGRKLAKVLSGVRIGS